MSKISELFNDAGTFLPNTTHEALDISKGGHFGFAPNHAHWRSEKAYVKQNLTLILLEAPKFMSLMNDSTRWYSALRSFVESQPSSVTGFEAGLTVNVVEHAAGAGGEVQQDYTNVTRSKSEPVFNFSSDRAGNVIQKMISTWITYGMSDPETIIPLAITLPEYRRLSTVERRNWLGDWYSMTFLAFEPNQTMTKVVNSWLVTNSWPTGTGNISGKRDISNSPEVPELSFTFTAYSQFGEGINRYAETLLSKINFENANPSTRKAFYNVEKPNEEVSSADGTGYTQSVEDLRSDQT